MGTGLDGVVRARADRLVGILNGGITRVEPGEGQADPAYLRGFRAGKRVCKAGAAGLVFGLSREHWTGR